MDIASTLSSVLPGGSSSTGNTAETKAVGDYNTFLTLLTAQGLDNAGNAVGAPATETLVVEDVNGPSLQVTLARKVVPKGTTNATGKPRYTASRESCCSSPTDHPKPRPAFATPSTSRAARTRSRSSSEP